MKLRVLFDISVLGAAHAHPQSRTGVFRYVDRLARFLIEQPDIDLRWTPYGNTDHTWDVLEALRSDPTLQRPITASLTKRRCVDFVARPVHYLASTHAYPLVRPLIEPCKKMQQHATFSQHNLKNADIIHSPFHSFPTLDYSQPRPVRFLTVHDLIPLKFPELFDPAIALTQQQTLAQLTRRDWIICNSQNTRNDLLDFCDTVNPDHVVVTPLAAAAHFTRCTDAHQIEQVRRKLNIPRDAKYFLSVCTLEPRKNLRHLVSVFEQILNRLDKDTYLVLVGAKGWKIDSLIQYLAKSGNQNILTPGKVDEEDLAPLYSDAIAFVYPSLYEGFGLPPLEAMQCGTPVICSDNSSLPEVVGDAGILVDAEQSVQLGDAMTRIYADHQLRRSLSAAGMERAQRFSWQQCGQMTVNAYQRAIESIE